jgi:hypothetical protein
MKNARPQTTETSAPNKRDSITLGSLEAGIQAGEIVGATDYPEADRPLFSSAIGIVLDDMPCVRPTWRTIGEHHVDGIRTRQKMFRICPRQKGVIDATLAGLIALAIIGVMLLSGVLA